jgi:helix-turn-helix protein
MTNDLVDCRNLIQLYQIGNVIQEYSVKGINHAIDEMLEKNFIEMQEHLIKAKNELHWEKEEQALILVYKDILEINS